jgi:hypothetical protein
LSSPRESARSAARAARIESKTSFCCASASSGLFVSALFRVIASPWMISSSVTASSCAGAASRAFCFVAGALTGLAVLAGLALPAGFAVCALALRASVSAASTVTAASPSDSDRQKAMRE